MSNGGLSMKVTKWNVEPSRAVLRADGPINRWMLRAGGVVRDGAKAYLTAKGRVDTGRLRNSITVSSITHNTGRKYSQVFVTTDVEYAGYVHDGTTGPILPRRAQVLRFKPKGAAGFVFARSVSGVPPTPFLTKGLEALRGKRV